MSTELRRTTTAVADIIRRLESDAPQQAAARVALEAVDAVFTREGPGWPGLAPRTQRERRARGYNPQHPILTRSGSLRRSATATRKGRLVEISIEDGRYPRLARGGPNLPPRPVRLGEVAQQQIADAITRALVGE
jgi:hypothetical protein